MINDKIEKTAVASAAISVASVLIFLWAVVHQYENTIGTPFIAALAASVVAAAGAAIMKIAVSRSIQRRVQGRVFLVYAHEDRETVDRLYEMLREAGLHPWMDSHDLLPGQDWRRTVDKALRETDVALVCLSKAAVNKTGYVQQEIKSALDILSYRREDISPVIPVRLEETNVPERLCDLQWVDIFEEGGREKLLCAVRQATA